ncbi:MAG: DUF1631 domain-containing protein [Pseudomonadales bacterium]|nr:DUF1631 domain-containing protein [Pseudomonadales bacterium]
MDNSTSTKHLAALQNLTLRLCDKSYEDFFQAIENRVMEMSDAAKTNDEQWHLMQLSRELRRQKASMLMAFKRSVANGFQLFQKDQLGGKDTSKQDMSRDLSLLADEELEQDLAVSSLARRAETRFSEELFGLMQRLAILKGGRKLPEDGNPLGAAQFALALQSAIEPLKLEVRLTVVFFRVFEKTLLENLGEFYAAANAYLKQQGVLPNLRFGVGLSKPRSPSATTSAVATPDSESAASSSTVPNTTEKTASQTTVDAAMPVPDPARTEFSRRVEQDTLHNPALQQTLVAQRQLYADICSLQQTETSGGTPPAPGAASVPHSVPTVGNYRPHYFSQPAFTDQGNAAAALCTQGEVVAALAQVPLEQHAEVMDYIAVPPAMTVQQFQNVTQQLRQNIGEDKQVAEDDGRIIDLVGMIFEYMLSDKELPDAVKAVLSYLHTPYLKVAFIDRALFEKPEHSSRQLLNSLAEAGARWVNTDGGSQFKVFPKIKSVIRRILTDFQSDTSLFDELLLEMREFNQKVERSIEVVERRAREKAEGEERLRDVKRCVLREIRQRMEGHDLPSHIIVLLLHPWSDYLTFTMLRHGEDSSQWQEGVDTIDEIIWSVQEKQDANERNRLMLIQDSLLARVQTGLETIAHDQAKSNKLLEALTKSQMLVLQNMVAEPAPAEKRAEMVAAVSADLQEEVEVVDPSGLSADEKSMLDTLSHVAIGTWLEFDHLDEQENVRARIAWFNARTSHYMLVDRGGKQVAVKSGLEIARMLLGSQARMLVDSGKPFFERALENIVARLKAVLTH